LKPGRPPARCGLHPRFAVTGPEYDRPR
jgi:hypothetical protein